MQSQVPYRSAGVSSGHDPVVGQERVEDRGGPDSPNGRRFQTAERHRLDSRHAAVVDPRPAKRDYATTLSSLADRRVANIVKSHHAAGFFDGVLDRLLRRYVIFYIVTATRST